MIVVPVGGLTVLRTSDGGATWVTETLPDYGDGNALYLSHDGRFLTLTDLDKREIIVLRHG
jgi:hypothetical protein